MRRGTGGHRESGSDRRTSPQDYRRFTPRKETPPRTHHRLTAYDYATARLVDEAGVDVILVGDSLAQTMLGYENTLSVTVDEMLHHTRAVRRAVKHAFLIVDMPFGSYHVSCQRALTNAVRFVKEGGAEVVKIEGGEKRVELISSILDAEIPVCGHIGLTPQSVHKMGGYKVQGKNLSGHRAADARRGGAGSRRGGLLVLEGIPREVAAMITAEVETPTIGIGAGPECDGQILVFHDLVNLTFGPPAKFVRRYADAGRGDYRCGASLPGRCYRAAVSLGRRVLPPAEGNARGSGHSARSQAGDEALGTE